MSHILYNKANAQRIYNQKDIKRVDIWYNCILVVFKKGSPRFTSKKDFKQAFAQARRDNAVNYSVSQGTMGFSVRNVKSHSHHLVKTESNHLACDCEDWRKQKQAGITTPTCSHAYATLFTLGYRSLGEYVEQQNQMNKQRLMKRKAVEQIMQIVPELNQSIKQYNAELSQSSIDGAEPALYLKLKVGDEKVDIKVNDDVNYRMSKFSPWKNAYTDLRTFVVSSAEGEYERQNNYSAILQYV